LGNLLILKKLKFVHFLIYEREICCASGFQERNYLVGDAFTMSRLEAKPGVLYKFLILTWATLLSLSQILAQSIIYLEKFTASIKSGGLKIKTDNLKCLLQK
jgi:hypothetical protein